MDTQVAPGLMRMRTEDGIIVEVPCNKLRIYKAHQDAKLPFRATPEAAAMDVYSVEHSVLYPGDTKIFSIGLIMQPPAGYHIKLWGRSGWGAKYGVGIPHGMGLIDRDYCGPEDIIKVVLHRPSTNGHIRSAYAPLEINVGDRIAQMTVEKTNIFELQEVDCAPKENSRHGFGSSGIK